VAVERLVSQRHSLASACAALSKPRACYYRSTQEPSPAVTPRGLHPNSLTLEERVEVVAELTSDRFSDVATPEVHATLLDEGRYLCSKRTMYRLFNATQLLAEVWINKPVEVREVAAM